MITSVSNFNSNRFKKLSISFKFNFKITYYNCISSGVTRAISFCIYFKSYIFSIL
ncbi:hypothetical protein [Campylobacter phage CJLB-12]|nr:hypothetical protein [Campylobacter phage CJLB-12]